MSSPIRVGLVGLGQTTAELVPGGWGAKAHLPYLLSSPKYQLVAVVNSSVQSAKSAIAFHKLDPEVKAYGSADELANDPEVDLVIVSVHVSKHYALTKPALLAGKDVFVEWPLGVTASEAVELKSLADANRVKTIVGAQGCASPIITKVRELISTGRIGKVISSTVLGSFAPLPHDIWSQGAEYFLDLESGGNALTISFGHFLGSFMQVLGGFDTLNSILRTDYPTTNIINEQGEVVARNYPKTSPDYISIIGTLTSGAAASLTYRTIAGKSMDSVGIRWIITGTDGEVEITTPEEQWQVTPVNRTVLKARLGKGSEIKIVDCGLEGEVEAVTKRTANAVNTARLYEAFALGQVEKYQDFGRAVELHQLLERIRGAAGEEWMAL